MYTKITRLHKELKGPIGRQQGHATKRTTELRERGLLVDERGQGQRVALADRDGSSAVAPDADRGRFEMLEDVRLEQVRVLRRSAASRTAAMRTLRSASSSRDASSTVERCSASSLRYVSFCSASLRSRRIAASH